MISFLQDGGIVSAIVWYLQLLVLFICMFCWSLFVLLYFSLWPLCCLFLFDIRIMIAPLVSSSSSYSYVCFVDRCLSFWRLSHTRVSYVWRLPHKRVSHVWRLPHSFHIKVNLPSYSYVCFVDRCLSFCTFPFGHCVVCSSSIYGFWLPLWYLQALVFAIIECHD
jgi:hypothetical protein